MTIDINYLLKPFTDVNLKTSTQGQNLPQLDAIRGIAVLLVIGSHTSAFGMYGQGGLGVLIFFMLSGFVLTLPYANNPNKLISYSGLKNFFISRLLRIMPAFIIAVISMSWLIHGGTQWILENIILYKCWCHFWSVAQEARFYLLFPFVIWVLKLPNYIMRFLTLGIIMWISWKYQNSYIIYRMELYPNGDPFRFWTFLGGILAAIFYKSTIAESLSSNQVARIFFNKFFFYVFLLFFISSLNIIKPFWKSLFPHSLGNFSFYAWDIPEIWCFLILLLLLNSVLFQNSLISRMLHFWPLRHLGLLSYSLYLFHVHVITVLSSYNILNEKLFILVLIITYFISLISYILCEKPFLILKRKVLLKN